MDVTLLYFNDCPNWLETDAHLRTLAAERPDLRISRQIVDTPEKAEETRFRGSPSILVNGVDAFADLNARALGCPAGSTRPPRDVRARQPSNNSGPSCPERHDRPL